LAWERFRRLIYNTNKQNNLIGLQYHGRNKIGMGHIYSIFAFYVTNSNKGVLKIFRNT